MYSLKEEPMAPLLLSSYSAPSQLPYQSKMSLTPLRLTYGCRKKKNGGKAPALVLYPPLADGLDQGVSLVFKCLTGRGSLFNQGSILLGEGIHLRNSLVQLSNT